MIKWLLKLLGIYCEDNKIEQNLKAFDEANRKIHSN